jgi:hypothetical protein
MDDEYKTRLDRDRAKLTKMLDEVAELNKGRPPSRGYVSLSLDPETAWNLALFLKRLTLTEIRANAQDEDEAQVIGCALEHVEKLLRDEGVAPR